jgi:type II secretory pathway pseudopilin PulG
VKHLRANGFSYVEVLIAMLIIVIALVPAINSLRGALKSSEAHTERATAHFHLSSRIHEILALPLTALDVEALVVDDATVPTSYSDGAGSTRRRLVYLARYDGDNADGDGDRFTGGDEGLLWVKVQLEGELLALESITGH